MNAIFKNLIARKDMKVVYAAGIASGVGAVKAYEKVLVPRLAVLAEKYAASQAVKNAKDTIEAKVEAVGDSVEHIKNA